MWVNKPLNPGDRAWLDRNRHLVYQLNSGDFTPDEIRQKVSEIIKQPISETTEIRLPWYTDSGINTKLGKHVYININATFNDLGGIVVDDYVFMAPNVKIITVNHPLNAHERTTNLWRLELKPVHIKKNVWIGTAAIILPGVTVGENAVIAAGAVVTKDVPENTVVAGVPAKVIKQIDN